MSSDVLEKGTVSFHSEGRLLQELGLRLVASPEIALVELIKNSYDADSVDCQVELLEDDKSLVVRDHGQGMTLDDFLGKWMQIATSSKTNSQLSGRYKRPLTGAKGIGRFAVRYLGDHLTLESTAKDPERGYLTTLKATFDWPKLDKIDDLSETKVPYELTQAANDSGVGTTLTIKKLRNDADFVRSKSLRSSVLKIVSPLGGLDSGHFHREIGEDAKDPGFVVTLPGDQETEESDVASLVLQHYWARLTVSMIEGKLSYTVLFPGQKKPQRLNLRVKSRIKKGIHADIRFFPRRKGVFQAKEVNGKTAWTWVRDNSGIAVVDHGFRIRPYGFKDDDWLFLDRDAAHNERNWRSDIAQKHFAIPEEIAGKPGENPALNLPHNAQLVGAVFVETGRPKKTETRSEDLIPAMDREGLLDNEALAELREYVRAGIEFLAVCDKDELVRIAELRARESAKTAREDIRKAITHIEDSQTLARTDKVKIVKQYRALAERLEEQEEYSSQARSNLLTMSLLGVVAGFMTHESEEVLHELEQASREIKTLARKHSGLKSVSEQLETRLETFRGYLNYSRLFIRKVGSDDLKSFSAAGQVRHVISRFGTFADQRGIAVDCEIGRDVAAPVVPLTAYSGILLNLYSNALKAILSVESSVKNPRITFRGWNEPGKHIIEVLDNGVGVPPEMRRRIFDPLFTTTSDPTNPLGTGMGLGLSLVKQVLNELKGTIKVAEPAPGFTTCFRVTLPL